MSDDGPDDNSGSGTTSDPPETSGPDSPDSDTGHGSGGTEE